MRRSALLLIASFGLALPVATQAQDGPRQLNTQPPAAPARPDTTRRAAPRELAAPPVLPDSVREQQQQRAVLPPAATTRYAVGLKTGQVYRAYDVMIKQPLLGRSFLLLDGQQRFDLDAVRYYEDETGFYVRTTLPGRSKRETTLRRDKVGRLSLYSITSTQYAGNGMGGPFGYGGYGGMGRYGGFGGPYGYGGPMYRTTKTEYFSKDNGPIEDLSLRNLMLATADNQTSTNLLLQARNYQRYTTLSYVAAGGLIVAGLVSTLNSNTGPAISPLLYGSVPFLLVPLVLGGKSQNNMRQAISIYNRGL